ncbi:MAG: translation initiation factor IF-2 [Dehalococcoidia bacterium]|nr:translation initiation factor IF-2 [Dehalococcoidia bacterium]
MTQRGRRRNQAVTRTPPTSNVSLEENPGAPQVAIQTGVSGETIALPQALSVRELADLLRAPPIQVIKQLMRLGVMAAINDIIDYDAAAKVAGVFGVTPKPMEAAAGVSAAKEAGVEADDPAKMVVRPPVITILGHVDHGKTTLLDAIRQTEVAAREVGGITQHIGAYQVEYKGQKLTFLDTPGHAAFTAMRARGAQVTDIAVLVVAADDGFMPQTVEALDHAKAAKVPIVVAINKIDKEGADTEKVKRQMVEQGLVPEEWGGETVTVPVSAKKRIGLDTLLESLLVVAEVQDLRANPDRAARAVVIEALLDKSKGPVAHILVQKGTLHVGDHIVVGNTWGRVKAMINEQGRRVRAVEPSTPVEILGLDRVPEAGDVAVVVADERTAKSMVQAPSPQTTVGRPLGLEEVASKARAGEIKELPIVLKCDVQGSVEAIMNALAGVSSPEVQLRVIHSAAGAITESDVYLANASKGIIVGFTTRVEPGAQRLAEQQGVEIRLYNIIYTLTEELEKAIKGMAEPVAREVVEGRALVKALFAVGKRGQAAGCVVQEGRLRRGATARVLRNGKPVFQGTISSLRHFKEDAREITAGMECGMSIDGFNEYEVGDTLEAVQTIRT